MVEVLTQLRDHRHLLARAVEAARPITETLEPRRLLAVGDLVAGFGDNGLLAATRPDGSPVDVINVAATENGWLTLGRQEATGDAYVLRHDLDGSLDLSFAGDGVLELGGAPRTSLSVLPDGDFLVPLSVGGLSVPYTAVHRFNADGSDEAQWTAYALPGELRIAPMPDGGAVYASGDYFTEEVTIGRLGPDGRPMGSTVDLTEQLAAEWGAAPELSGFRGLSTDAQGRIYVGTQFWWSPDFDSPAYEGYWNGVFRLTPDLQLDTSYELDSSIRGSAGPPPGPGMAGSVASPYVDYLFGTFGVNEDGTVGLVIRDGDGDIAYLQTFNSSGTMTDHDRFSWGTGYPFSSMVLEHVNFSAAGEPVVVGGVYERFESASSFERDTQGDDRFDLGVLFSFDDDQTGVSYPLNTAMPSDVTVLGDGTLLLSLETPVDGTRRDAFLKLSVTGEHSAGQLPFLNDVFDPFADNVLEAEHYDVGGQGLSFFEQDLEEPLTARFRDDDVDLGFDADESVDYPQPVTHIDSISAGEWYEYTVDIHQPQSFDVLLRAATTLAGVTASISVDGSHAGTVALPVTGQSQYKTIAGPRVALSAGKHVVRVTFDGAAGEGDLTHFEWLDLAPVAPQQSYFGTPPTVDGNVTRLEAEHYDTGGQSVAFFDTDPQVNHGGDPLRGDGVDIKTRNGVTMIGWTQIGEWLEYTIHADEPTTVNALVNAATGRAAGYLALQLDGEYVGQAAQVKNAGWYNFQTYSLGQFEIPAGTHVLRLQSLYSSNGADDAGDIDWLELRAVAPPQQPFGDSPVQLGDDPVRFEAEHYDQGGQNVAFYDTDPGVNHGADQIRGNDGVDIKTRNGVTMVGWARHGEWLEYTLEADEERTYEVFFSSATGNTGGQLRFSLDGQEWGSAQVPNGGWYNFSRNGGVEITIPEGRHVLRVSFASGGADIGDIDWFELVPVDEGDEQQSYFGKPISLDGDTTRIQAEHFDNGGQDVAFHDTDPAINRGGDPIRGSDGVDIKTRNGVTMVGWTADGEWLEYSVSVSETSTFDVLVRVGTGNAGSSVGLLVDGRTTDTLTVVPNNGWYNFQTLNLGQIKLTPGTHVLRLQFNNTRGVDMGDVDWLELRQTEPSLAATLDRAVGFASEQLMETTQHLSTDEFPEYTDANGVWVTKDVDRWIAGFFPGQLWEMNRLMSGRAGSKVTEAWRPLAEAWADTLLAGPTQTEDIGYRLLPALTMYLEFSGGTVKFPQILNKFRDAGQAKQGLWNDTVGAYSTNWRRSDSGDSRANFGVLLDQNYDMLVLHRYANLLERDDPQGAQLIRDRIRSHATLVAENLVREDGSTAQWAYFDRDTGEPISRETYQGLANDSTWSRGQAWGILSFSELAQEAVHEDVDFFNLTLDTAKKVADWFIEHLPADMVPYWDFDAPASPDTPRDSSAAAIAASGLLTLAQVSGEAKYRAAAEAILASLARNYLAEGTGQQSILLRGSAVVPAGIGVDAGTTYGDYYFLRAIRQWEQLG